MIFKCMHAAARAMGAETTRVTPPDDKCRENLRHAEREIMITIIIPAKRKMTNSTSYCASPHFLNSSSRVRESWEKSHHLFKRIKSAGDRVGRNCSLDREFYAWHKWHEQSNLQPREILMWAISAARKGAERYARISSTSQPYPENVNDSGIAQLQLKDAYQCTYAIVACYYYFCFSRPHVFS